MLFTHHALQTTTTLYRQNYVAVCDCNLITTQLLVINTDLYKYFPLP